MTKRVYEVVRSDNPGKDETIIFSTVNPREAACRTKLENDKLTPEQQRNVKFRCRAVPFFRFKMDKN